MTHTEVYGTAYYYDIAFGYRDYAAECDFLWDVFARHATGELAAFLELAAGPARHALEMARRGAYAAAIDLSPEMAAYGLQLAAREQVELAYHCGDMIDFTLERSFDMVATLLDSASYLLTNEAVYAHFASVSRSLRSGGLYVLEMQHPSQTFRMTDRLPPAWETPFEGGTVRVEWGHEGDVFDPTTQQTVTSTSLIVSDATGERLRVEESAPQRCFGANELRALVDATPHLELVGMYGALDTDVPFDSSDRARYMVPILRRV